LFEVDVALVWPTLVMSLAYPSYCGFDAEGVQVRRVHGS
jgi:hypothetical protein